jgi:integrase
MSVRKKILHKGTPQEEVWWIADYTDGSGRRHQPRFKHKRDAEAHEEKSKVAIRDGRSIAVADVTVADAARIWISRVEANGMRHRGPVERATLRQYRQHVDLHILPRIGKLKLPKLTRQAIGGFRDALLKDEDGRPVAGPGAQGPGVPEVAAQGQQLCTLGRRRDDRHGCPD